MESWIYFVIISEFMWSCTSLFDKILLSKNYIKSPKIFIIFNGLMNVLLIFLLPFFSFGKLGIADILIALLSGIFLTLGVLFYYKAVQNEEISRVLMLWQLVPAFTLILSFLFLNENLTLYSLIGFVFLFSAGLIISYKKVNGSFKLGMAFYYMAASTVLIAIFYLFPSESTR